MKKIIILQTSGNELANQLWNYASIYSYALEKGYELENPSFFEYGNYFNIKSKNTLFKIIFFNSFTNYTKRKTSLKRRVWRKMYFWYANIIFKLNKKNTLEYKSSDNIPYYLSPSKEASDELRRLESSDKNIFLNSWLFRNPAGLMKYRVEIKKYFTPRDDIHQRVVSIINELRTQYKKIVGVHVRQGDYKDWRSGVYYINQKRVRDIINQYISKFNIDKQNTCFVFTSDGKIETDLFDGINTYISKENAVTDLFLLSNTDYIIGSDSTFGAFASYLGDIPIVVMNNNEIDWDYYKDRVKYFENKYCTMVHF